MPHRTCGSRSRRRRRCETPRSPSRDSRREARRSSTRGMVRRFVRLVVPPSCCSSCWCCSSSLVVAAGIPPFVLASPSAIWAQLVQYAPQVLAATIATGLNALIGLLIGAVLGVVLAIAASSIRSIDGMLAPSSPRSRSCRSSPSRPCSTRCSARPRRSRASSSPARRVRARLPQHPPRPAGAPVHRDLMRAYAASSRQQTRFVTIPSALPHFFTGLRIASSLAVISALVAEYFGGPREGSVPRSRRPRHPAPTPARGPS